MKIKIINKITVQTVYSCCPDSTEAPTKYPNHAIKPNCHLSNEIADKEQKPEKTEVTDQNFRCPQAMDTKAYS